ncbi:MAG: ribonuclease III [Myxococcota bacterium]
MEEGGSLAPAERAPRRPELEKRLGHRFRDPSLLEHALTHRSRAHEEGGLTHGNERLEFLGDAVVGLLVAELLMEAHPEAPEGILSRARATLVNRDALAEHARRLGLDREIRLGRSEESSDGRAKPSILADTFEAVLGAIYLDGGLGAARALVLRELGERLEHVRQPPLDAKTRLQELLHARRQTLPRYETVEARGPDHAREFVVEVRAGERVLGRGRGRSKREAEQEAARTALAQLEP